MRTFYIWVHWKSRVWKKPLLFDIGQYRKITTSDYTPPLGAAAAQNIILTVNISIWPYVQVIYECALEKNVIRDAIVMKFNRWYKKNMLRSNIKQADELFTKKILRKSQRFQAVYWMVEKKVAHE